MTRTGLIAYILAFAVAVALLAANYFGLFNGIPHGFQIAVVVFAVVWIGARLILGRMGHLKGGRGRTRPDQ
jgi:hypothetical protein